MAALNKTPREFTDNHMTKQKALFLAVLSVLSSLYVVNMISLYLRQLAKRGLWDPCNDTIVCFDVCMTNITMINIISLFVLGNYKVY